MEGHLAEACNFTLQPELKRELATAILHLEVRPRCDLRSAAGRQAALLHLVLRTNVPCCQAVACAPTHLHERTATVREAL